MTCSGAGGSVSQTASVAIIPAPTLSFTAVPATVQAGTATQLTWSATDATSCTASGSWSGTKAASGTQSSGALSANATFTLTCTGAGGTVAQTAAVTVSPAPTLTLTAAPTSIQSGGSSQLTWTTTNAAACTASGSWSGSKAVSGTEATGALTNSGSYALTCIGDGGTVTKSASVTVQAAPTLTLSASPTSVQSGSASQLTWSTTNATSCIASGGWTGTKATTGSQSTGALAANTSYTLTCSGAGGSVAQTASIAVTATPTPTLTLGASPTSVASGGASQLTWAATNATSCTASGSWSGTKATSGTQSTGALTANSSYTLTCTGSGGSVAQTAAVTVTAARAHLDSERVANERSVRSLVAVDVEHHERDQLRRFWILDWIKGYIRHSEHGRADRQLEFHAYVRRSRRHGCTNRGGDSHGRHAYRHPLGQSARCRAQCDHHVDVVEHQRYVVQCVRRLDGHQGNRRYPKRRTVDAGRNLFADVQRKRWQCGGDDYREPSRSGAELAGADKERRRVHVDEPRRLQDLLRHRVEELHPKRQRFGSLYHAVDLIAGALAPTTLR